MRQIILKRDLDTDSIINSTKLAFTGNQARQNKSQRWCYRLDHWCE